MINNKKKIVLIQNYGKWLVWCEIMKALKDLAWNSHNSDWNLNQKLDLNSKVKELIFLLTT